jgi:SP family arabinose:H+ symporter-like MFS transporter
MPESPRWLLMRDKKQKAMSIMLKAGGKEHAENEYNKIIRSLQQQTALRKREQFRELFSRKMGLILFIGFGLAVFQQVSGINSVLYYAPMIFESAGSGRDAAFIQAIAIGLVFLVTTILSMIVIDRLGRKPLLYAGVSIMAVSLLVTGLTFRNINSVVVLISILTFIAGFSISLGPVMWAMFSEIFPNRLRGLAISMVGTANSFTSFLVATFFPVQIKLFGSSNTFLIYSGCMFLCLVFVWRVVVETKGKSLEDLEKELIR